MIGSWLSLSITSSIGSTTVTLLPSPKRMRVPSATGEIYVKLRVHAREWTASKLRPKVYGQQIDVSVQHTQISVLAALEMAERRVIELG